MQNILNLREDNLGGANYLLIAPESDVLLIPSATACVVSSNIQLKSGKQFYKWVPTKDTLQYSCDTVESPEGKKYFTTITALFPKHRDDLVAMLDEILMDRFVCIVRDNNLKRVIVGCIGYGCQLKYKLSTEAMISGRNSVAITITYEHTEPNPYYTGV